MNRELLIDKAKKINAERDIARQDLRYVRVMEMFQYLGIIHCNIPNPARRKIKIADAIYAGEYEPRVFELLPALVLLCPEIFDDELEDMPNDLGDAVRAMKRKKRGPDFRGIAFEKYIQWVHGSAIAIARRRFHFRTMPRRANRTTSELGALIRTARHEKLMTQAQLAESNGLSLRVIRDIEQGKLTASFKNVEKTLRALGLTLEIS